MRQTSAVFFALIMVSAGGCGGGGSGSTFTTSVPSDKPLGTLSTADATKLCNDTGSYVMAQTKALDTKDNQCRLAGVLIAGLSDMGSSETDAMLQQACQAGYQACLSAPADTTGVDAGADMFDCSNATLPANCTATVAQYTACVNEQLAEIKSVFIPCDQLTRATLMASALSDGGEGQTGPACTALEAACPGVSMMTSALRN